MTRNYALLACALGIILALMWREIWSPPTRLAPRLGVSVANDVSDSESVTARAQSTLDSPPVRAMASPENWRISVADTGGVAIAGASCIVYSRVPDTGDEAPIATLGVTDRDGTLRYAAPGPGSMLRVTKEGYSHAYVPAQANLHIALHTECRLAIRCLSDNGRGVSGVKLLVSSNPITTLRDRHDVVSAETDVSGNALIGGLRTGRVFVRAIPPSAGTSSDADGLSPFELVANGSLTVRMRSVWLAGVEVEGEGRMLARLSVSKRIYGTGVSDSAGRAFVDGVRAKFPNAAIASATWPSADDNLPRTGMFFCWHSRIGWFVEEATFTPPDEFQPERIPCKLAEDLKPGRVAVEVVGPDGRTLAIRGLSLRTGNPYGIPIESEILGEARSSKWRNSFAAVINLETDPVEVPPGSYRIDCNAPGTTAFRASPDDRLSVESGGHVRHVMRMQRDVVHVDLRLDPGNRGSWGRAQVQVEWGQRTIASMAVFEDESMNVVPPAVVPCDEPITVRVHSPGFEPASLTTVVSLDDPRVHLTLKPQ